jgi:hypothetical protein
MILNGGHKGPAVPSNKGMKLSKPEHLGGDWPIRPGMIESGFAAYTPCSTDQENLGGQVDPLV